MILRSLLIVATLYGKETRLMGNRVVYDIKKRRYSAKETYNFKEPTN